MVFMKMTRERTTKFDRYRNLAKLLWKHISKLYRRQPKPIQQRCFCWKPQKVKLTSSVNNETILLVDNKEHKNSDLRKYLTDNFLNYMY